MKKKGSSSIASCGINRKEKNAGSLRCAIKPCGRALEPEGTAFVFSLGGCCGQGDERCIRGQKGEHH